MSMLTIAQEFLGEHSPEFHDIQPEWQRPRMLKVMLLKLKVSYCHVPDLEFCVFLAEQTCWQAESTW